MAKIQRKMFAQFINATPSATATYEKIGCDNEELTVEMNMEVNSTVNVCGGTTVKVTQGTKQMSIEPYFADQGTDLFDFLQDIIDNNKELDDLKTDIVDVKLYETPTLTEYPAIKRECFVELVSYGGDTQGYQIPYNVHLTGVDVAGTFDPTTLAFTPA